jgi:hypothetical protein
MGEESNGDASETKRQTENKMAAIKTSHGRVISVLFSDELCKYVHLSAFAPVQNVTL